MGCLRARLLLLLLATSIASPEIVAAQSRSGPGVQRLRDMSALRSAAKRHPYAGKVVRRTLADGPRTIESVGAVEADRLAARLGWVPLGADPELRKVTVATVMRKVRQRSRSLRKLIAADPDKAAWDIVFIGAGVHTAIAASTLAGMDTDDPVRMLTIEASNDLGGTFRQLGSTVARNSANRASEKGQAIRRGFGNKNESDGPWGDPDLDGQEYPELGILADTATVNLFASGSDFLLGSRVEKIEFRGDVRGSDRWPARYRVTSSDGTVVYANAVARSTGLGRPTFGLKDRASMNLIKEERAAVDFANPDEVPGLLHFVDAMRLANASYRGRDAYRAKPTRRPPFTELRGTRIRTSRPAILQLGDRRAVPLDEVIALTFDGRGQRWRAQLADGRVLNATRVVVEIANRELILGEDEGLLSLAKKIRELDLPDPVQVRVQSVSKKIRAPLLRPEERLAEIKRRSRYDLGDLKFQPRGSPAFSAARIADVFRGSDGSLTVVRQDGKRFRTLDDDFRLYGRSSGRQAIKIASTDSVFDAIIRPPRPVIAVIGGRDSGRTFLEYLYGQAPASAYNGGGKIDNAQRGDVGDVEWYVGERGPEDCDAFLATTRSRYLRLAGKVRDAGDGSNPRAELHKARVMKVARLQSGRYQITDSRGETRMVDKVIFATGFVGSVEEDGPVDAIKGTVDGLDGERVLAKQVRGRDIFRFGPAAGEDVVGPDERFSTDENAGSLYAFGPRDRKFAATVLAKTVRAIARLDTPSLERTTRVALTEGKSEAFIEPPVRSRRLETPLSDLVLRAELLDVLSSVRGATSRKRMTFRVTRDQDGGLKVEHFNHAGADKLAQLISDSTLLHDQLEDATAGGASVEVSVPLRKGVPIRSQLTISM